jgi:pyruvate formate-lyase activating enzyme-like uncharacterized protein
VKTIKSPENGSENDGFKQTRREIALREIVWNSKVQKLFGNTISPHELSEETVKLHENMEHLKSMGVKSLYDDKKLFIGKLSKGCESCGKGTWACMYINLGCTRDCFFCMEDKPENQEKGSASFIEKTPIRNRKDLIHILKELKSDACGISGGEPLLVLSKAERYISYIKEVFGSSFRIHLYTNGDLIKTGILRRLKNAGLDEIRFNLSANGYDVKPVEMARKYFSDVTVEIPCIPKDEEYLFDLINQLDEMKVKYLNLHELMANPYSIERIKQQGYHIKNIAVPFYKDSLERSVKGSEELALRLLEFIIAGNFSLSANYCSYAYKTDVQVPKRRINLVNIQKKMDAVISCSEEGFIRKVFIFGPGLDDIARGLINSGVSKNKVFLNYKKNRLETHIENLSYLQSNKYMHNQIAIVTATPNNTLCRIEKV